MVGRTGADGSGCYDYLFVDDDERGTLRSQVDTPSRNGLADVDLQFVPLDLSKYKNILSYIQKITKRPAYQSYLKKADADIEIEKFVQGPPPPMHPALAGHK